MAAEKENLLKYAEKQGVTNISFLGRISKNAIPTILEQMDVLYIGLQKQPLFQFGISPNKIFDYMMSARPVINAITAGNDPIMEANCGLSVESEDANLLADATLKMS